MQIIADNDLDLQERVKYANNIRHEYGLGLTLWKKYMIIDKADDETKKNSNNNFKL